MTHKRGFCCDEDKYSKDTLIELIEGRKKRLKVSNAELGKLIGITGQAFGNRLKQAKFEYIQLIKIFQKLDFTHEEIVKIMTQ